MNFFICKVVTGKWLWKIMNPLGLMFLDLNLKEKSDMIQSVAS